MATKIGEFLRKIRLANDERLKDMADHLEVTSAFLSAVENGKKKMPASWEEKLQKAYNLDADQVKKMRDAVMESSDVVELNISNVSAKNRELAISFARQFDSMDDKTSQELLSFLKKRRNAKGD